MENKPRKTKVWIVILVIVGLLASFFAGGLTGGIAGYLLGRNAGSRMMNGMEWTLPEDLEQVQPWLTPALPDDLDTYTSGALITDVVADSPAEEAGLQEGDLIVSLDDVTLGGDVELTDLIQNYEPGDQVLLGIIPVYGTLEVTVSVTLGRNPDKGGETAWLGIEYQTVDDGQQYRYNQQDWQPDLNAS